MPLEDGKKEELSIPVPPKGEEPRICDGCLDPLSNCIPYGTRLGEKYCDIDKQIKLQASRGEYCNNNYECDTNLCINNKCIGRNFIEEIFAWFRRIFGG